MFASMLMSSSIVAFFLLIWFKTEAYVEYCRLFKLNRISHYKDYDEKKKNDVSLTYHYYLREYHNGFFIRLITCPICVSVWLAIFNSLLFFKIGVVFVTCVGGLILFGLIHKLLN